MLQVMNHFCRVGKLTDDQKMEMACELSKRISLSVHTPLTTASLGILEKIG